MGLTGTVDRIAIDVVDSIGLLSVTTLGTSGNALILAEDIVVEGVFKFG
jgi:hypothetical protein